MFPSEGNIFCPVDERLCYSTGVDNPLMIVVSKAYERFYFLFLCSDRLLEHGFQFRGINLDFLTIDNILQKYALMNMELGFGHIGC